MSRSCEIFLMWMRQNTYDDNPALIQLMVWWRQATDHHMSRCSLRFMSLYGVIRPQWINAHNVDYYNMFQNNDDHIHMSIS